MSAAKPLLEGDRDDDLAEAWINALQGHPPMQGVNPAARAGALLRQLVLQAQQDRAQEDAAFGQALINRWGKAGLLSAKRQRRPFTGWLRAAGAAVPGPWLRLVLPAAAAACLAFFVLVTVPTPPAERSSPGEDSGVSRGAETAQQMTADDPAALALRITQVLQRGALALRRVDLPGGGVQLQASLPAQAQAVRQDLAAMGVAVPAHGRLNLVITKPR